jgi:hypothetical protein
MRDAYPRQDQEAALVGDLVHVRPAHFRRPADEAVTRSEVPRRGGEAQAGERSPGAQGQGLHLLTDAPHRAQVMAVGDQVIEESLQRRAAHRPQFDRAQGVETPFQRRAVHLDGHRPAPGDDVVRRPLAHRGQLDVPGPVQDEQQAAADPVAQRAIGLAPVPVFAQALRERPAAGFGMRLEQGADGFEVAGGDRASRG